MNVSAGLVTSEAGGNANAGSRCVQCRRNANAGLVTSEAGGELA